MISEHDLVMSSANGSDAIEFDRDTRVQLAALENPGAEFHPQGSCLLNRTALGYRR